METYFSTFYQESSGACTVDITPPTFAGIASLTANPNGSLTATWIAATDSSAPIRYEVYIQADTATGLFSMTPALITENLTCKIFTLNDGSTYLVNGTTYHVGVRAVDSVGNIETNTASLSAVSVGVIPDTINSIVSQLAAIAGSCAVSAKVDSDEELSAHVDTEEDLSVKIDCEG